MSDERLSTNPSDPKAMVESVAALADQGKFAELEQLYAEEEVVDYTSLSGGAVEKKSASELMSSWARLLPGFDRTRHKISDVEVTMDGDTASAAARIDAAHWVGDLYWYVSGRYNYRFEYDDSWHIVYHQFVLEREEGTRDVFVLATKNAEQSPHPYLKKAEDL